MTEGRSQQIPERVEREMFEIRTRMAPDMSDLRKHIEPQVVGERIKETAKVRLKSALRRAGENMKAKAGELGKSAKNQLSTVKEAGRKRNPHPFTDAVRSDRRPLIILAILLATVVMMARRLGREGE